MQGGEKWKLEDPESASHSFKLSVQSKNRLHIRRKAQLASGSLRLARQSQACRASRLLHGSCQGSSSWDPLVNVTSTRWRPSEL